MGDRLQSSNDPFPEPYLTGEPLFFNETIITNAGFIESFIVTIIYYDDSA